ncbi:MAG: C-GCAxxG-C-C family protein [Candidatus Humimicrobiaceae bacterium]
MADKNKKNAGETAKELFSSGYNCSESCLLAICRELKLENDIIPKIATGFGGGVSRLGSICGALSGTIMAMGIVEGRNDPSDNYAKITLYKKGMILINAFNDEFKSTDCRELTECDMLSKEGIKKFEDEKIHEKICSKFVEFAALRGIELLKKNNTKK